MNSKEHYNKNYFEKYQKDEDVANFRGRINSYFFRDFISQEDIVLDFGCGNGCLLENIDCKEKYGVEINDFSRKKAKQKKIKVETSSEKLKDNFFDVIISHHVLEHTERPLDEIKILKKKLKEGGKIIFIVPHELRGIYKGDDKDMHLYTWTPLNLGNLFKIADFRIKKVEYLKYQFPPYYLKLNKIFGDRIFNILQKIYCLLRKRSYQVRIIAEK